MVALAGAAWHHSGMTMRNLRLLAATLGATFAAAALAAAPAQAAGPAWLAKKTHFTFSFWKKKPGEQCISRSIYLADGYYSHGAFMVAMSRRNKPDMATSQDVGIQAGTYRWEVCRWYANGKYQMSSEVAGHERRNSLEAPYQFGEGMYEWGGRLELTGAMGVTTPSG
jgi:hypothetical protein